MTTWIDENPEIVTFIQYVKDYFINIGEPFAGPGNYTTISVKGSVNNPSPPRPTWTPGTELDYESTEIDDDANIGYKYYTDLYDALTPFLNLNGRSVILDACIPMFDDESVPPPHHKDINFYQINGFADSYSQLGPFNRETFKIDTDTTFTQCRGLFYICMSGMCQDYWVRYYMQWPELTKVIDEIIAMYASFPKYNPNTYTGFDFVDESKEEVPTNPELPNSPTVTVTSYKLFHVNYPTQHAFWQSNSAKFIKEITLRIKRIEEMIDDIKKFPGQIKAYKDLGLAGSKVMSMAMQFENSKRQIGPLAEYNMVGTWEIGEDYIGYFNTNASEGWLAFKESSEIEFPEEVEQSNTDAVLSMMDLINGSSNKSILETIQAFNDNPENAKTMLVRAIALERMGFFNQAKTIKSFLDLVIQKYKWLT